jgi:hypothetical protein
MKQTVENCVESHEHGVFDHAYIPERLIDLRTEIPRLILRGDHDESDCSSTFRYAALSYCWGSGEGQVKTTVATLSNRQVGITETEVPLAIRDAKQVTRALDIPFLWVDALCILQDDPSDWERQCTEMHHIYGSALVTLCAANSTSCGEGFLRQTGLMLRIPYQSRRLPDTNLKGAFLIQYKGLGRTHNSLGMLDDSFIYADHEHSLWQSRGWVFQESTLSTRRLVFEARDLYFLCKECHQRRGQDEVQGGFVVQIGKDDIDGDPRAIYGIWTDVLTRYSSYTISSFTHATDILPALSGMAQVFYGRLKDGYYAGHWGRDLYRSLLWFQLHFPHTHSERFQPASFSRPTPEPFIVPSWSNLNKGDTENLRRDYKVDFNLHDSRSEINLLEPMTRCSLRIRGYTLDLSHEVDIPEQLLTLHEDFIH